MANVERLGEPETGQPKAEDEVDEAESLPLVQAWVPDHRNPEFEARLAREAAIIAASSGEREVMEWLDRVRDTRGWVWEE